MAHCAKCGRLLGPGEGRKPATTSLFGSNGLVCDKCFDEQKGGIAVFFTLFFGLSIGAVSSCLFCVALKPFIGVLGYGGAKAVVIATSVVAIIGWFFFRKRKTGGGVSGCLARAVLWMAKFFLLWFAIGSLLSVFLEGGSLAKSIWGIKDADAISASEGSAETSSSNGETPQN